MAPNILNRSHCEGTRVKRTQKVDYEALLQQIG